MSSFIGSTGNVPVTASLPSLGCSMQGPNPYLVAFVPVTASATATPLPPGPISLYINPSLAAARDLAIASSGLSPGLASYLFMTAYLDYLRNGGA